MSLYSCRQSCYDTNPEDELRRKAPQLVFWVLICPSTNGDNYKFIDLYMLQSATLEGK